MSNPTTSGISICGYTFEGPYTGTTYLKDRAGVYAVMDHRPDGWHVLDVGESTEVKTRIENHERASCWKRNARGTIGVAVLYAPGWTATQRRTLEREIRNKYRPPCGEH